MTGRTLKYKVVDKELLFDGQTFTDVDVFSLCITC